MGGISGSEIPRQDRSFFVDGMTPYRAEKHPGPLKRSKTGQSAQNKFWWHFLLMFKSIGLQGALRDLKLSLFLEFYPKEGPKQRVFDPLPRLATPPWLQATPLVPTPFLTGDHFTICSWWRPKSVFSRSSCKVILLGTFA